jgi:TatD DNase family protein
VQTLPGVPAVLADEPRIVSLHSYRATEQVLGELSLRPVPGVVLHWWLGSVTATRRAVERGCYFSVSTGDLPDQDGGRLRFASDRASRGRERSP